ncbi:sugar phosphate isomerase/epimerase family protein [Paenibacillus lemnae]|uniref:Sugar phosphate isomerase/epimerase n=1 Tax=Paenibacillus lemnae TaxID=1330551 RepID=A0A848M1J1_PAELE|nr:sugar phosphate isomerase/epimerase family protein [Paenibacillus lemnae]NMO94416.1 sugar phosphate isomerase/epimerase [Paenibacillus lemnae]
MSVGVLAHLFGSLPYRQLAETTAAAGFSHVQLALWKAVSDVDFSKAGTFSPGLAQDMGDAFRQHGVSVSVLGCYVHLFHRDEEIRRENIERFKELLRYAPQLGCRIVAAESGVNPGGDYTYEDWSAMRDTLSELAEEAEKWGVFVGMEAADGHLIGSADSLHQLLSEVPSTNVGVVIDPGNLLNESNIHAQDEVIEHAFELLGSRIIAGHAKDRLLSEDGSLVTVPAGLGIMNYELYLKRLHEYKPHVQIIMEEAKPEQMQASKAYIEQIREQVMQRG